MGQWSGTLQRTFEGPLRVAVIMLWSVGVLLAGGTAMVAWIRLGPSSSLPFVAAATMLGTVLVGVVGRSTWALMVTLVGLGAQGVGVVGTIWELAHGVAGSKAHELRRLGVNPRLGVALNLVYSAVAFAVFAAALKGLRDGRATSNPRMGE